MLRDTFTHPKMFAFVIHHESRTKSWKRASLPPATQSRQQPHENHPVIPAPPTMPHRQVLPGKVGLSPLGSFKKHQNLT